LEELPWLDYTGQTTSELLACKNSHRIDSLLCAFEEGIQAKLKPPGNGDLTEEENLVLGVMALDREVNNGGYHQFFLNSSCRFAPVILDYLRRIECAATEAITGRAIAALQLPDLSAQTVSAIIRTENPERDEILDSCDREFYKLSEITPQLFAYIETHQDRIRLVPASLPPRPPKPKLSNASKLFIGLGLAKKTGLSLDGVRQLASELAQKDSMAATDSDLEGAAVLYAFSCAVRSGDLAASELLASQAFELMREDTMHCVLHRDWVLQLIGASKLELAETWTSTYLEYLGGCGQWTISTQNRVLFWAAVLKQHTAALPKSVEFLRAHFPEIDLDKPLPARLFVARERPDT
jgi:uncharacterized protein DUF4375